MGTHRSIDECLSVESLRVSHSSHCDRLCRNPEVAQNQTPGPPEKAPTVGFETSSFSITATFLRISQDIPYKFIQRALD